MKVIRFLRGYPPYNTGETAGFEDGEAARIVATGAAAMAKDIAATVPERSPDLDPPTAQHPAALRQAAAVAAAR